MAVPPLRPGARCRFLLAAVLAFKKAKNLGATYKLADNTPAFHPFIDEATKQAMIRKLSGQP